jgi:hypothetical protein
MAKEREYPTIEHIQEVTLFRSKKHAQGALETLKWLDQGAPHKFDGLKGRFKFAMDVFICDVQELYDADPNDCGTVCCIAGAIYSFCHKANGDKPDVMADMDEYFGEYVPNSHYGLLPEELKNLFYANGSWALEYITPKQAARTLRKYLKKGIVDWSHLKD